MTCVSTHIRLFVIDERCSSVKNKEINQPLFFVDENQIHQNVSKPLILSWADSICLVSWTLNTEHIMCVFEIQMGNK